METLCVFPDEQERQKPFAYLNELEIKYHKPYKRFNQTVKVPRGQASHTAQRYTLQLQRPNAPRVPILDLGLHDPGATIDD